MGGHRIAVTGAAGRIGTILRNALGDRHELRPVDVRGRPGSGVRRANSRRPSALRAAFEGTDTVIDLASQKFEHPWAAAYRHNIPAAWHALEAARQVGAARLIYFSSNHVTGGYERDEPYASIVEGRYDGLDPAAVPLLTVAHPVRPDSPYGAGKVLGEAAGRYFSDEHGLSVICLRIGTVNAESRPHRARHFATLLTARDLIQLVELAIEAPPEVRYGVFYGVSANTWRFWDIADAETDLGYRPVDDAESFRER